MSKFPKPMLATNVTDFNGLFAGGKSRMASPKLDGIRGTMHGGIFRSRSLKDIPNVNVQKKFKGLPDGLDGEFIVGSPTKDPYKASVSVVMSDDKSADEVRFYVFDTQGSPVCYAARYELLFDRTKGWSDVIVVPHHTVSNLEDLATFEQIVLDSGYEGVMLNDPAALYKHGRASERSGELLKVKRFVDAEARVLDCECEYENQNIETTNELGRTHRSSHKAGKVAKDTLGVLHVRSINGRFDTIQHDVAVSSMDHETRKAVWEKYKNGGIVGEILTYKYFEPGSDEKPRHPIFKGWRDRRDM